MSYVIGVDAGGFKTLCAVADVEGRILGLGRAGTGNWQASGISGARDAVRESIETALTGAGIASGQVAAAYFGMAGADRPPDFERVRELLQPICSWPAWSFENDAAIALRSEVPEGPGIGVICGSGTNVIGLSRSGERVQIGGFGFAFGDSAGAGHIGTQAMRHAWRAADGRGPESTLVAEIETYFGLDSLPDVIELLYAGSITWGNLAPLVFSEAERGDQVSRRILIDVGEELALAADAAWRRLFPDDEAEVPVVAGGSVFQKPTYPLLFDTFSKELKRRHLRARIVRLTVAPVLGAVFGALQLTGEDITSESAASYRAQLEQFEAKEAIAP